jgi:NAD(P)-dependent dehydrogenase (short-subunit alcohol dehydrogenase family)
MNLPTLPVFPAKAIFTRINFMSLESLIITRANGNLGKHVVSKLLADGWTIYASALSDYSAQKLQLLFPDEFNNRLFVVVGDLSNEGDAIKLVKAAGDTFGYTPGGRLQRRHLYYRQLKN